MKLSFKELSGLLGAAHKAVLARPIGRAGSTPRSTGATMAVLRGGSVRGGMGGALRVKARIEAETGLFLEALSSSGHEAKIWGRVSSLWQTTPPALHRRLARRHESLNGPRRHLEFTDKL